MNEKYKYSEDQPKRDKHITIVRDKVNYLNTILNDFLSIERLESGTYNYKFSNFRISKVINEVVYNKVEVYQAIKAAQIMAKKR